MSAVLAALARAVLGTFAVLGAASCVFWSATGPQGFGEVVRLAVMFAAVTAALLAWVALAPRKGGDGR